MIPQGVDLNLGKATTMSSCIYCKTLTISPQRYVLFPFYIFMFFNLRAHLPTGQALGDEVPPVIMLMT